MSIKVWPVKERPREKLLYYGAEYLSDAELIAVMLGAGVAGKTALGLARDLLEKVGSLRGVVAANEAEFRHWHYVLSVDGTMAVPHVGHI